MDIVDLPHRIDDEACRAFQQAVELAGRKWTASILLGLALGSTRFTELRQRIDGLSDRMLTVRLRELEADGLVEREVVPSTPVQVRYALSPAGRELIALLHPLTEWAHRWDVASASSQRRSA